jgi:adenosylhomocysteine nucleosidase
MFFISRQSSIDRLLILVAMEAEEIAITNRFPIYTTLKINSGLGLSGKQIALDRLQIVLVNTGIGLVNAGVATALACDKVNPQAILLLGVAGALSQEMEIGETVLATQVIQHDSFFSGETQLEDMAPGFPFVSVEPSLRENPRFNTDQRFQEWLMSTGLPCRSGLVLSGSEFVGSSLRKRQLASRHQNSLAIEMESAGVALVAKKLNLPFAVVKTIADRMNPDDSISTDYKKFLSHAAESAAKIISFIAQDMQNNF